MTQLKLFNNGQEQIVNTATVPLRSPFRYPGGKTWMVPLIRRWLDGFRHTILIEPFAGGGIISLTAVFEDLTNRVLMAELDPEVAAVWKTMLGEDCIWLLEKITSFELSIAHINEEWNKTDKQIRDIAFSTILKNRVNHGGIITKGAGQLKNGENGKGIASRWYPQTLAGRIRDIYQIRHKITFLETDAFELIDNQRNNENASFFIDPPYQQAGKRLYTYNHISHVRLFELATTIKGRFLITYEDSEEMRELAQQFGFPFTRIPMKTTHHRKKYELIIGNQLDWM